MRILNRTHVPWFIFVCLASAAATCLYVANFHPERLPMPVPLPAFFGDVPPSQRSVGGTPLGLIFGAVAFAIFIFAALLGVRKKIPLWRIGTVQRWLRAHIWLTLLTIPLVFLHSGFRFGGPMTTLLVALYTFVMVSGIYGLFLQHQVPRLMKERLPAETVYEQIPHIRAQLCAAAEKMRDSFKPAPVKKSEPAAAPVAAATAVIGSTITTPAARAKTTIVSGATIAPTATTPAASSEGAVAAPELPPAAPTPAKPEAAAPAKPAAKPAAPVPDPASEALLVEFLEDEVLPYLRAARGEKYRFGKARVSESSFRILQLRVALAYRTRVEEMESWCNERRLLDLQTRLHHWLHGWLFVHVPLSFLLLLLTAWHAFVTLFHY